MSEGRTGACGSSYCTSWTSPGVIYDIDFQGCARKLGVRLKQSLQGDILDRAVCRAAVRQPARPRPSPVRGGDAQASRSRGRRSEEARPAGGRARRKHGQADQSGGLREAHPSVRPSPAEPAASQSSPPAPRPARRPHHHHQGLAVHRREPPATSPAAELQGGRHLAGADLRHPEVLLPPTLLHVEWRGRDEEQGLTVWGSG